MRGNRVPLLLTALTAGCASYRMTIEPPPTALPTREASQRVPLSITVKSTYAPYVDGDLSTTDLYPRDRRLGQEDLGRYREALLATQQFVEVTAGDPGPGLHCALTVVSGREPARDGRRALSLLTFGQLSHEQREIVRLEVVVSRPGREPSTYRLEGRITTDAGDFATSRTRRSHSQCGPEGELARALVSRMVTDGWLDAAGSRP